MLYKLEDAHRIIRKHGDSHTLHESTIMRCLDLIEYAEVYIEKHKIKSNLGLRFSKTNKPIFEFEFKNKARNVTIVISEDHENTVSFEKLLDWLVDAPVLMKRRKIIGGF